MSMALQDHKTSRFVLAAVLCGIALALSLLDGAVSVSYTHLTLPTNREVLISGVAASLKKKKNTL